MRLHLGSAFRFGLAGAFREAADACLALLGIAPDHREASVRLRRAARRIGDGELLLDALRAEVRTAPTPEERAWALASLAHHLEEAGDLDEARAHAAAALHDDPRAAEAALLLLRRRGELPNVPLGAFRALFGDSPPVLALDADIALQHSARETVEESLAAWATVAPFDPEPWLRWLDAFSASTADEDVIACVEAALEEVHLVPDSEPSVLGALTELAGRDRHAAARLALLGSDAFGERGQALRELATTLSADLDDALLAIAAIERRMAGQPDDARVALLHELAVLHRRRHDRAAEARTLLRVLAFAPHDAPALSRLVELYAETGERERLNAALALELEGTTGPDRVEGLRRLAAAAHTDGDLDRAEAFLRDAARLAEGDRVEPLWSAAGGLIDIGRARRAVELLRERGRELGASPAAKAFLRALQIAVTHVRDPRLALAAAIEGLDHVPGSGPLLVAFEALSLQLRDTGAAQRTYARLRQRAMGPHGRRALSYREGRWLERAGASAEALRAYLHAFEVEPQGGALFASIERLAREQDDLDSLVWAYGQLADKAPPGPMKIELTRRAAQVVEVELEDVPRAFGLIGTLWESTITADLEGDLSRLGARLRALDEGTGDAAFRRLVTVLDEHAEQAWVSDAKARLHLRAARLIATGRGDLEGATVWAEKALDAARTEESSPSLRAQIHLELATWLLDGGDVSRAAERVALARAEDPEAEGLETLERRLSAAGIDPSAVEAAPGPHPEPALVPAQEPVEPEADADDVVVEAQAATEAVSTEADDEDPEAPVATASDDDDDTPVASAPVDDDDAPELEVVEEPEEAAVAHDDEPTPRPVLSETLSRPPAVPKRRRLFSSTMRSPAPSPATEEAIASIMDVPTALPGSKTATEIGRMTRSPSRQTLPLTSGSDGREDTDRDSAADDFDDMPTPAHGIFREDVEAAADARSGDDEQSRVAVREPAPHHHAAAAAHVQPS